MEAKFQIEMILTGPGVKKKADFICKDFRAATLKFQELWASPRELKEQEHLQIILFESGRLIQQMILYGPYSFFKPEATLPSDKK